MSVQVLGRRRHGNIADLGNGNAVRAEKGPIVTKVLLNGEATFVHERVMPGAEQQQVAEIRIALVAPVFDMVTVEEAKIPATGKRTGVVVSCPDSALDARRDNAGLAADSQGFALAGLRDDNRPAIAAVPLD